MAKWYQIPEWYGIQQHKDGTLLPTGTAYDARNIETGDGNLSTAKGYTAVSGIPAISGGPGAIRLIMPSGAPFVFVARTNKILRCKTNATTPAWSTAVSGTFTKDIDYVQTRIGTNDVMLVTSGSTELLPLDITTDGSLLSPNPFSTGLYSFSGTVSAYDSATLEVTLSSEPDSEAARRCVAYGITLGDEFCEVDSISADKVYLKYVPNEPIQVGATATIRGGGSNAKVKYVEMYANRLFAAGDSEAPCRLYWSCVPGDGRTIADWLSVDGSYDASGGYVEVGDNTKDPIIAIKALSNQLIIWKRYSVWRLYGDRPSTFTLECIDREGGLMSNSGVITKYDTPYYLMPDGIHMYNGSNIVPADSGAQILRRFFALKPDVSESKGLCWNNRFYLTCKLPASPAASCDNAVIVYDVARGSYMIRDGFQVADMVAVDGHIYMLLAMSNLIMEFEVGSKYNAANISAYWLTQPMDFGAKMQRRQLLALYAHLKGDGVKVTSVGDYVSKVGVVARDTTRDDYTVVRFQSDQSHFVQLKFENIDGGTFSIQGGININAEYELKE